MKDRRLTPANKRVADPSLESEWPGVSYVDPEPYAVNWPLVDLMNAPEGHRDRQLLFGETVGLYETHEGWAFVRSDKDGYVGYVPKSSLAHSPEATHRISAAATHVYEQADFKSRDRMRLSHGCLLHGMENENGFLKIAEGYVPMVHCSPVGEHPSDPVSVAKTFLDTPYLWGGNSRFGIDCSGLVQAAFTECGVACAGDSDLQEDMLGYELPADAELKRNDLLFWKGHVAMIVDETRLIHANAHHMAVSFENTNDAIARIERQGDGPVTSRKRVLLPNAQLI
ncbi:C40 family peptidase [Cognatishimia activa]|uniref:Dipeptidyl-peptidase 6 n=1 Tax=Cognatishimia activa TaxID=1715691 RepID=A0A0P1IMI1_9RHOB|nr:NlpC/P60 family protein [Cognatishimia activa]CUI36753.1 Dipeptidyl-peptidase 6 [Cognatishimia activa]CUK24749.1 Dipeptidyl-peptidase 6 [Cognatishimia activa]